MEEAQDTSDTTEASESPEQPEDWVPLRSSWKPSAHTWPPLAESWQQAQKPGSDRPHLRRDDAMTEYETPANTESEESSAVPVATQDQALDDYADEAGRSETILYPRPAFPFKESYTRSAQPTTDPEPTGDEAPAVPQEVNSGVPWLWRPLVWINCAFAAVIALVGPPGRWLTGSTGRTMLGVVGIACLVGAIGLVVADWLGWTW
jgi:hypothetical protein